MIFDVFLVVNIRLGQEFLQSLKILAWWRVYHHLLERDWGHIPQLQSVYDILPLAMSHVSHVHIAGWLWTQYWLMIDELCMYIYMYILKRVLLNNYWKHPGFLSLWHPKNSWWQVGQVVSRPFWAHHDVSGNGRFIASDSSRRGEFF